MTRAERLGDLYAVVVGSGHPEGERRVRERRRQEGIQLGRVHRDHGR